VLVAREYRRFLGLSTELKLEEQDRSVEKAGQMIHRALTMLN
jgi:hypothetical protein